MVDACTAKSSSYGALLLEHYGRKPRIIVLTHPHLDHARGLRPVIENATSGERSDWPVLGMVLPPDTRGAGDPTDPQAQFEGGTAEQVVATILDRWERSPACRWDLSPGGTQKLGHAKVTALSPERDARNDALRKHRAGQSFDPNRLSAALLVEWGETRIVLGSDLPEKPGGGWSRALRRERHLPRHAALKVPHHGSTNALPDRLLRRPRDFNDPVWMIAPYASRGLPDPSPKGGLTRLLRHVERVHLTALPRKYASQSGVPMKMKLRRLQRKLPQADITSAGFPDCFVAAVFSPGNPTPDVQYGPGSVLVMR